MFAFFIMYCYQCLDWTFYQRMGVPSTRFPTSVKKEAGATDRSSGSSLLKMVAVIVATIALCFLALLMEGVLPMIAAMAVNLASHFTIGVGSRVEGIAKVIKKHVTWTSKNRLQIIVRSSPLLYFEEASCFI